MGERMAVQVKRGEFLDVAVTWKNNTSTMLTLALFALIGQADSADPYNIFKFTAELGFMSDLITIAPNEQRTDELLFQVPPDCSTGIKDVCVIAGGTDEEGNIIPVAYEIQLDILEIL